MSRILINAVSAKHGGARTIVESLITAASGFEQHRFIVLAGFKPDHRLPQNVTWHYRPKSGMAAMTFSLAGIAFYFLRHRADILISFNNINTILVSKKRRWTYFHQLKALDPSLREIKLKVIRAYLRCSREPIILQSEEVRRSFTALFGEGTRRLLVAWPGVEVFEVKSGVDRGKNRIIVPVTSPHSAHKNFGFILDVARALGSDFKLIVTAPNEFIPVDSYFENIEFIGALSREKLFEEYQKSTVCLIGSTHETVGLPIFEALSVGLPVVTFDAPYARALRDLFGIAQGWALASNAEEAANQIRLISGAPDQIVSAKRDFRESDWAKVLHEIREPDETNPPEPLDRRIRTR